ncbi:MAG: hypothetical protein JXR19_01880 [Bacteroidia bacterium]
MIGVICIALLVYGIKVYLKQINSKEPALVIDEKGLLDKIDFQSPGFIEWKDIIGVQSIRRGRHKSIGLLTNNSEKYIESARTEMVRRKLKSNLLWHGTALLIYTVPLKMSQRKALILITEQFNKFGNHNS